MTYAGNCRIIVSGLLFPFWFWHSRCLPILPSHLGLPTLNFVDIIKCRKTHGIYGIQRP